MADVKQILVVDDHFEMLEFLRSMLELSSRDHQVLGVPSGEEGFLELRRTPFDLVITDVRLPGMSGFELVRQIQTLRPELPIIMITAYSSRQGKREADELGVYRYFEKPLDTEALLAAVHTALYGEEAVLSTGKGRPVESERALDVTVTDEAQARLQTLRSDTGAAQIALAAIAGDVIFSVGEAPDTDVGHLARFVAKNVGNSLQLGQALSSPDPVMIHYLSGDQVDLYSANVGHHFFLMMLFDVGSRRGRIGTIWIFAQRAIKDLRDLLQVEETGATGEADETVPGAEGAEAPRSASDLVETPIVDDTDETPARETSAANADVASGEVSDAPVVDVAATETKVEEKAAAEGDEDVGADVEVPEDTTPLELTEEDAELAALFEDSEVPEDVETFWDEALAEEAGSGATDGLSLEEARRRGLIPPEFGASDE